MYACIKGKTVFFFLFGGVPTYIWPLLKRKKRKEDGKKKTKRASRQAPFPGKMVLLSSLSSDETKGPTDRPTPGTVAQDIRRPFFSYGFFRALRTRPWSVAWFRTGRGSLCAPAKGRRRRRKNGPGAFVAQKVLRPLSIITTIVIIILIRL